VTSKAAAAGIKGRLAIPIPYVAPFIELGLGASAGTFRTFTPVHQITRDGVLIHIPVTLGLALGSEGQLEVALVFLYYPAAKQFGGGTAFGMTFPL
jgi:hypothetical protein